MDAYEEMKEILKKEKEEAATAEQLKQKNAIKGAVQAFLFSLALGASTFGIGMAEKYNNQQPESTTIESNTDIEIEQGRSR